MKHITNVNTNYIFIQLYTMPIKDRRLKILFCLFIVSDFNFSPSELTEDLLTIFDLSMNQKTKGTLSALTKEGSLEKVDNTYKLTEKGFIKLCLEFPFFRFMHFEWDGLWRVISYEIPESKREIRDRLRREMRGWGLGPWHRSFWLTPHPIIGDLRELVYGHEEESYIQAFEATHVFGDMNVLVEKVWVKSELDKNYRELFKTWHTILSTEKKNPEKMKDVIAAYIELLRKDPGLPESLIGKKWIGFEAFDIFKEVRGILLK